MKKMEWIKSPKEENKHINRYICHIGFTLKSPNYAWFHRLCDLWAKVFETDPLYAWSSVLIIDLLTYLSVGLKGKYESVGLRLANHKS